ncbi:glycoside hydrolase domain-containing protein [Ornithinibacillus sp. 179-J 7C1 HS]|uniref:glycoside hydrolase domain-containing protein n=1 Tax=Ornithinibacillus sp. 179-J 7C1 HS TaxID=3142384 RepID=UPI00399FCF7F
MKKYELFTLASLALVIAIPLFFYFVVSPINTSDSVQDPDTEEQENNHGGGGNEEENSNDGATNDNGNEIHWGVDSATYTDEEFLGCVVDNFGKPVVWGRYLGEKEGVSEGIDKAEIQLLHDNDIQILVIYNHVEDARGYDNGVNHAEEAIAMAEELEIPEDVAIFVDIEPDYPVDAAFMEGWYQTMVDSNYEPGVYGVFDEESELLNAYNSMEQEVQENTIVWTAYPQEEVTTKENAPDYNPQGPDNARVYGWQYAIDSETCNIDTNLFEGNMLEYLW